MNISKNGIEKLGKAAGFLVGTWLLMQAVPAVSYGMLVIADGIRVALGWGSML